MSLLDQIRDDISPWVEATDGNQLVVNPPARIDAIISLENEFGMTLPEDLRSLYLETNGIWDSWYCFSILRVEEALEYNRKVREHTRHFSSRADHLAFSHRDGDYYFYEISSGATSGIYLWDHETDDRTEICADLKRWIGHILNKL